MRFLPTELPGVLVVEPDVYRDGRGFFLETFHASRYAPLAAPPFVQDNQSRSTRGTLRGLHAQRQHPQGKLLRAVHGIIYDVAVDIRVGSPTFAKWIGVELSDENFRQIYVPPGFAHGFCVLSEMADVEYRCTDYYHPEDELRLLWNDPKVGVQWPVHEPILSDKDLKARSLTDLHDLLPVYSAAGGG